MSAKPKPTRVDVKRIAEAISGRGRLGRSPLYWWMWDHFDQLWKERQGRADWISVTKELTKLAFTNRDGSPLKPENVRKAWSRVVADRKREAERSPQTAAATRSVTQSPPPTDPARPAMPAPPARTTSGITPDDDPDAGRPFGNYDWTPSKPR